MQDDTVRKAPLAAIVGSDDLQLTTEERRLILNYRAMKACAQEMLVDISGQYRRTMPAA